MNTLSADFWSGATPTFASISRTATTDARQVHWVNRGPLTFHKLTLERGPKGAHSRDVWS